MRNTLQPRPERPRPVRMAAVDAEGAEEADRWRAVARRSGALNFRAWVMGLIRREVERAEAE